MKYFIVTIIEDPCIVKIAVISKGFSCFKELFHEDLPGTLNMYYCSVYLTLQKFSASSAHETD